MVSPAKGTSDAHDESEFCMEMDHGGTLQDCGISFHHLLTEEVIRYLFH